MSETRSIDTKNIRIAFVTDDGETISPHFGRALYFEVITLNNGSISSRKRIEKPMHHGSHQNHGHQEHSHEHAHGMGHDNEVKHAGMIQPIMDCQVLVARGMGNGAHNHLIAAGITPFLTAKKTIQEALEAVTTGSLDHHPERLH